jgi:hypothetical protein
MPIYLIATPASRNRFPVSHATHAIKPFIDSHFGVFDALSRAPDSTIAPSASVGGATISVAANSSGGAITVSRAPLHGFEGNIPPIGDAIASDTIFGGLYLGQTLKITVFSLRR